MGSQGCPSFESRAFSRMRTYLDNHDVLRQMQELLQDNGLGVRISHEPPKSAYEGYCPSEGDM